MSDVARYSQCGYDRGMTAKHDGDWVHISDYQTLRAELARVCAERNTCATTLDGVLETRYSVEAELAAAKEQLLRATDYARRLVIATHRDHYAGNTKFEPFDDIIGLLSQIDNMLTGWPPFYAASASQAARVAVKESLTTGERTAAEETYTRRAFDYEQNPIGSRDWTLFYAGWKARAEQSLVTIQDSHQPAAQVAQGVAGDVVRDYPDGWVFHSADFSMAASCPARSGRVTLVRDLAGRDWWLSLSDEDKERVPLYVYGSGNTLSDAIKDAAMLAAAQQRKEVKP